MPFGIGGADRLDVAWMVSRALRIEVASAYIVIPVNVSRFGRCPDPHSRISRPDARSPPFPTPALSGSSAPYSTVGFAD